MTTQTETYPLGNNTPDISGERYRIFIEEVADGFYETDLKGNFIFFNKALCRIFGHSEEEVRNHNYREFMDEKNAELAFESLNTIFRTGQGATDIVWEIIRKTGETGILEISANLLFDNNGEKIGFRGIARDITEKHLAREALKTSEQYALRQYRASREAEKRYRGLLDFLPDPVILFNLDSTADYLNPAFVRVFGWTSYELKGKRIPFVPDFLREETRQGIKHLFREKVVHGVETKRLTKDGRLLDILLNVAVVYGEDNQPAGQVGIFRDVTQEKRAARTNQALFRVAKALSRFRGLDERLEYITGEVHELMQVEGASVILADHDKKEFFFRAATYENAQTGETLKEIRFPLDKGVAGYVYRTGQPIIVPDTSESPYFFHQVDEQSGHKTRNMLDVPIRTEDRIIGVLCAVNKKEGAFDQNDVELMNAIAATVALPIENARINEALNRSYEEVRILNRAKERVIHHLSHELKTPVSVMDASLGLVKKRISKLENRDPEPMTAILRPLDRAMRNLDRLLEMQYEIQDILSGKDYKTHQMLSMLVDVCADELEALFENELQDSVSQNVIQVIRQRIADMFGPRETPVQNIRLDQFVEEKLRSLKPKFAHRSCRLRFQILPPESDIKHQTSDIRHQVSNINPEALSKVVEGLIRNAVENTPDDGKIEVTVYNQDGRPGFEVRDFGVGITEENQRLIFESNITTRDTMNYSSRKPYDFNAGGKGFDLLRMKIFSERYHFTIQMTSERCRFIPRDEDICPGDIKNCEYCRTAEDCFNSGGTRMRVCFFPLTEEKYEESSESDLQA